MSRSALGEAFRRDIPLQGVALAYFVIGAAYLSREYGSLEPPAWTYVGQLLILLTIVSAQYGLRSSEDHSGRRFWNYFSFALALSLVAAVAEVAVAADHALGRLAIDCLHASYYLTLIYATELRPDHDPLIARQGREEELHRGSSVSFILALLFYCSVIPSQRNPEQYLTGRFSALFYLCLDFFFLARFAYLSGVTESVRWRLVYRCLLAYFGVSVLLLTLQYYAKVTAISVPGHQDERWDLLWFISVIPLFLAARWSRYVPSQDSASRDSASRGDPRGGAGINSYAPNVWEPIAFYAISFPLLHLLLDFYGQLSMPSRSLQQGLVIIYFAFFGFLALIHSSFRENKRRLAEEALRESEMRYRQLIESHPDAILIEQAERLVYVNATGVDKFGVISSTEVRSLTSLGLPGPPSPSERQQTAIPVECHVVSSHGEAMDLEVSYIDISYMGQRACQAIARDVTEAKRQRVQSERLARLASLGQFSAAMAHEIRNPLAAIVMHSFFLAERLAGNDENLRCLADINVAVERMQKLVAGILGFVRPVALQMVEEDMIAIVGSAVLDLERRIPLSRVQVVEDYQHRDATVQVDVHQMVTVFASIFENSVRAMPDGGQLILHAENPTEGRIEMVVEDTGVGIAEEDLERIFEPFFTRRDDGVGLGLALTARILDQHSCRYRVESRLGQGTRFILDFDLANTHGARKGV